MFTGIIIDTGYISQLTPNNTDLTMHIRPGRLSLDTVKLGDSIAINGVCLTVSKLDDEGFWFDVSRESLSKTTLSRLRLNDRVNLETALTPTTALGGHLVSGHVDGVAEILQRDSDERSERFQVKVPQDLTKYIVTKGSVCIDGVSLTVNNVEGPVFDVNIVPHTLKETIFIEYQVGRLVNIEIDVIARYLEKLLDRRTHS